MIMQKLTDLCRNGLLQNDIINTFNEIKVHNLPLPSDYGTYKPATARLWPGLAGRRL